jgi:hypothetical protein
MDNIEKLFNSNSNIQDFNQEFFEIEIKLSINGRSEPIILTKSNISQIEIIRDIDQFFSKIYLTITDLGSEFVTELTSDGRCKADFKITQIITQKDTNTEDLFEEDFKTFIFSGVIDSYKVLSLKPTESRVEISVIYEKSLPFYKCSFISIQSDTDIVKIINSLLANSKYTNEIKNAYDKKIEANQKTTFISDVNSTLSSHIKYLLSQIISKDKGFAFLWYNDNSKEFEYIFSEDIVKGKADPSSSFILQSAENTTTGFNTAVRVDVYPLSDLQNLLKSYKSTKIQYFDLEGNKFVVGPEGEKDWPIKKIMEVYGGGSTNNLVYPSDTQLVESSQELVSNETPLLFLDSNKWEFSNDLRNLFKKQNVLMVKVYGNISRQPGTCINLVSSPSDSSTSSNVQFEGNWFCYKIIDKFVNNEYYQYIYLIRSHK